MTVNINRFAECGNIDRCCGGVRDFTNDVILHTDLVTSISCPKDWPGRRNPTPTWSRTGGT